MKTKRFCCKQLLIFSTPPPSIFCCINNYLQQLYREVKGVLLYQGFLRPILHTKHLERREGWFAGENSQSGLLFYLIVPRDVK